MRLLCFYNVKVNYIKSFIWPRRYLCGLLMTLLLKDKICFWAYLLYQRRLLMSYSCYISKEVSRRSTKVHDHAKKAYGLANFDAPFFA